MLFYADPARFRHLSDAQPESSTTFYEKYGCRLPEKYPHLRTCVYLLNFPLMLAYYFPRFIHETHINEVMRCWLSIWLCVSMEQNGFDEAFLKDALLERIKDDVPEIVLSALKALQVKWQRHEL